MIKRFLIPFSCCIFCAVQYILRTCQGQTRQTDGGHEEKWRIQNWVSSKLFSDSYFLGCGTDTFWDSFFHYLVVLVTNVVFCTVLSLQKLPHFQYIKLLLFLRGFHTCIPVPLISPPPQICPLRMEPSPQDKKKKLKKIKIPKSEATKQQQQKRRLSSWKLQCGPLTCTVYLPLLHSSLLVSVLCHESLVLFKASCFCCIIDNGPSLGFLFPILLLPFAMDFLLS